MLLALLVNVVAIVTVVISRRDRLLLWVAGAVVVFAVLMSGCASLAISAN